MYVNLFSYLDPVAYLFISHSFNKLYFISQFSFVAVFFPKDFVDHYIFLSCRVVAMDFHLNAIKLQHSRFIYSSYNLKTCSHFQLYRQGSVGPSVCRLERLFFLDFFLFFLYYHDYLRFHICEKSEDMEKKLTLLKSNIFYREDHNTIILGNVFVYIYTEIC